VNAGKIPPGGAAATIAVELRVEIHQ